jgi:YVTN family beta-propeller protein
MAMNLRMLGLLATFVVSCLLGSAQTFAENAYITNSGDGTVSVINTETNTVIATIPCGGCGGGMAVSPDGSKVYIANSSNSVSIIATGTNTVVATIPVGSSPSGVAVAPDGSKVYVTNTGNGESPGTVSVIATATDTVIATIPVGFGPTGIAVTPEGSKVYVANFGVGFFKSASTEPCR